VYPSEVLSSLLANWDLESVTSIEVFDTSDYRCSGNVTFVETQAGKRYVLKHKTVQRTLTQEHALLAALYAQGLPVTVPKLTRKGEPYVRHSDEYFCLSPYLPGAAISDHYAAGAEERARCFGEAIAHLHIGLKQCQHLVTVPEMDLMHDVAAASQVARENAWNNAEGQMQAVLSELNLGLAMLNKELSTQLIHRDAHAANMLFLNGHLSGWLDFEIAVRGPRLFDLCYCATSLLMNGIDEPTKRLRWLTLLAALVEEYANHNSLSAAERSALWYVLLSIELIFAAYFTHVKDLNGVTQNVNALFWIYENRDRIRALV